MSHIRHMDVASLKCIIKYDSVWPLAAPVKKLYRPDTGNKHFKIKWMLKRKSLTLASRRGHLERKRKKDGAVRSILSLKDRLVKMIWAGNVVCTESNQSDTQSRASPQLCTSAELLFIWKFWPVFSCVCCLAVKLYCRFCADKNHSCWKTLKTPDEAAVADQTICYSQTARKIMFHFIST